MKKCNIRILLIVMLYCIGLREAVTGVLQLLGLAESLNASYCVTGSFYNPGPYACCLALVFPFALRDANSSDNKLQKLTGWTMALFCAILIPVTMSRTAIAACGIGGIIAMSDRLNLRRLSKGRLLALGIMCVIIAGGIYIVKKNSADGRLLMWKVAVQAAMEVPLTGVGWSDVAGTYGEAQEQYFASGKGSEQEIMVADAPEYVFNEYLQIAIAYGPLAAAGVIVMIAGAIMTAINNKVYDFAGSSAGAAVVMFASYPLQFPLFVIAIALVLSGAWLSSASRIIGPASAGIIVVLASMFLSHNATGDVRSDFAVAHSLHRSRNYRKSNNLLLGMLPHSADPMILNIIAKNYRALGQPDSAEHYLQKSINRCPNRLYPHYLLMQLYGDSTFFNPVRQRQEARLILNTREKIHSRAIEEMREEASEILGVEE